MRVAEPNEDDWKMLKRVLKYFRGTIDLVLTLGANGITKMKSLVNVLYGIHSDCNNHTGKTMSWVWGLILGK